jgi:hypothetical protein
VVKYEIVENTYLVKVGNKLLRDEHGNVRKFGSLWAAIWAAPSNPGGYYESTVALRNHPRKDQSCK